MDVPPDHGLGGEFERAIETTILDLLAQRGPGKTICPSEVARTLHRHPPPGMERDDGHGAGWRALMDPVREAAGRLVASGEIVATQRGETIDLSTVKGPIRLGRQDERRSSEE